MIVSECQCGHVAVLGLEFRSKFALLHTRSTPCFCLKMCRSGKHILNFEHQWGFFQFCSEQSQIVCLKSQKLRPPAPDHLLSYLINCIKGYFTVYSRPKTESSDRSLRAHTKMKNCHSTVCWSSPAPARSRPACTQHPKSKTSQLWMRSAAVMWRRRT